MSRERVITLTKFIDLDDPNVSSYEHGKLFTVQLSQYNGEPVTLSDDCAIEEYDWVAHIHLDNDVAYLQEIEQAQGLWGVGNELKREFLSGLEWLAHKILISNDLSKIRAVRCCSFLSDERIAELYGFDAFPIETADDRTAVFNGTNRYSLDRQPYSFEEMGDLLGKRFKRARVLWMSAEKLMQLYGQGLGLAESFSCNRFVG